MNYLPTMASIVVLGLAASGCATHDVAKLEARTTLAAAPDIQPRVAYGQGQASMAWGDRWTAANLFERSVDKRRTLLSHFNLAAAYQRTGRLDEAAANYRVVAQHGQYRWATSVRDNAHQKVNVRRFNLADEASRRLALLEARTSYASRGDNSAFAATEAGVEASATVGRVSGRVADAEAIQRDAAVETSGL